MKGEEAVMKLEGCKACVQGTLNPFEWLTMEMKGRIWQPISNLFFVPFDPREASDKPLGVCGVSQTAYEALTTTQKVYKSALLILTAAAAIALLYIVAGAGMFTLLGKTIVLGWEGKGLLFGAALGGCIGGTIGALMIPEVGRLPCFSTTA